MNPAIYLQYTKIVTTALSNAKLKINQSRRKFMLYIFLLYLSIPTRINFLQLERFSSYGEQRFRRQFEKPFDFFGFNASLAKPYMGSRLAVAFDPSFIPKSGKHTPGLGYFWSGCASKSLKGLEILGISLVDADTRMSFHLEAVQTPPINTLQDNELTLLDWYAAVLAKQIQNITAITQYMVADAFFSKKAFVDKVLGMGLHLVSRLRDDADLRYLACNPKTGKKGRPRMFGDKIDINNLAPEHFKVLNNNRNIKAWTAVVYSKSLQRNILVIIEEFTVRNKTTRRILFSTDTLQAPIDVQDIYHTRFQMEFGFRDAKQFTGLENSQARSTNKLYFHFNTALSAVNIAKVMQLKDEKRRELPFSMADCKIMFYNALLLSRFFDKFGISPNKHKNQRLFNELLIWGARAA